MKPISRFALLNIFVSLFALQALPQLNATRDGKLDRAFGTDGVAIVGPGVTSIYGSAAVLSDGSVIHVRSLATTGYSVVVSKQRPDGTFDPNFGQYGYRLFTFPTNAFGTSLLVQPDGKLLIVGSIEPGSTFGIRDFLVLRLLPNGELDSTFGNGGVFSKDFTPSGSSLISSDRASSLLLQPDGKIVVAGMSDQYEPGQTRSSSYSVLIRLDQNGRLDPSFGAGGTSIVVVGRNEVPNLDLRPAAIKFLGNGKIIAGISTQREFPGSPGSYPVHALLLRYLDNGTIDSAFSNKGLLDISVGFTATYPSYFQTVTEVEKDKLLILTSDGLLRLDADGTFDATFGSQGRLPFGDTNCRYVDFTVANDKKILVSRNCTRNLQPTGAKFFGQLNRFWPDGSADLRFGQRGKVNFELRNEDIFLGRITASPDRRIIVTGSQDTIFPAPFTAKFFGPGKL